MKTLFGFIVHIYKPDFLDRTLSITFISLAYSLA